MQLAYERMSRSSKKTTDNTQTESDVENFQVLNVFMAFAEPFDCFFHNPSFPAHHDTDLLISGINETDILT